MVSGPLPATMASPSAARFFAAFRSRSRTSPHAMQTYVRTDRASLAFTAPHPEQVLLDGNQRSTTTTRPPFHTVLYSNWRRICPNEASATCRARLWLRTISATNRSSTTTVPNLRASMVVSLWVESLRWSATLPAALASAAVAARQRFDGCWRVLVAGSYGPTLRDTVRDSRRTLRAAPLECRGLGTCSPVEAAARVLIPRSTPTTEPAMADVRVGRPMSTVNDAFHWPRSNRPQQISPVQSQRRPCRPARRRPRGA